MKIGFFGDVANLPYSYALEMQNLGHETILVVNRKELLWRPESNCEEFIKGYPDWIIDGSYCSEWDYISLNPRIAPILRELSQCDALFLTDLGPSLLPLINLPAISFLPGSDLTYYASFKTTDLRFNSQDQTLVSGLEKKIFDNFIKRQREGIRRSVAVRYFPKGIEPCGDSLLEEIGVEDSQRIFQFEADLKGIEYSPPPKNERIRVYCPVRLTWKLPIEPGRTALDYKGSDIMIRGLGQFYRSTGYKLDILLMRKGLHIPEIEQLVSEENISDQVTWLDEMPMSEYRKVIQGSDIILEQFGNSMIGRVGIDSLTAGRPVIGNLRPEILGNEMPVCQARTPAEIAAQLSFLVFDPEFRFQKGKQGRAFVEKNADINIISQKIVKCLTDALDSQPKTLSASVDGIQYLMEMIQEQNTQIRDILTCSEEENPNKTNIDNETSLLSQYLFSFFIPNGKKSNYLKLKGPFYQENGLCWYHRLDDLTMCADDETNPTNSSLLLFENEKLLKPAHSVHEDIRKKGKGRYSHWKEVLYFSTTDGSDPNTNCREYRIVYASQRSRKLRL